nr:hypothetical protein [Tanacetum cinerariifolium]
MLIFITRNLRLATLTPAPEKILTPNQLKREVEKLKNVTLNVSHQSSQEILAANNVQAILARVVEQVPLVLDELEWELSSLRAYQKAREIESEKNKQTLYFLLTTVILGLCSVLLI